MTTEQIARGDKNQELILPNKNTIEEFKGVKISEKYDFNPDKVKYAEEPPKAGANKKDNSSNQKTQAEKAIAQKAIEDEKRDEVDSVEEESLDLDAIKKKHLKVAS